MWVQCTLYLYCTRYWWWSECTLLWFVLFFLFFPSISILRCNVMCNYFSFIFFSLLLLWILFFIRFGEHFFFFVAHSLSKLKASEHIRSTQCTQWLEKNLHKCHIWLSYLRNIITNWYRPDICTIRSSDYAVHG